MANKKAENKEKAIRKAMKYYQKDMEEMGYKSGTDGMAFMNLARKAIEEYQDLQEGGSL